MQTDWENELADLLSELTDVQHSMLDVLSQKSRAMADCDAARMTELQSAEKSLCERLQTCHDRRRELLAGAADANLPHDCIGKLATALPKQHRTLVQRQLRDANARMRLLQHQSLSNWVMAQRTLLHLSQLLEIIATGGRLQPTYGRGEPVHARGALVDREV